MALLRSASAGKEGVVPPCSKDRQIPVQKISKNIAPLSSFVSVRAMHYVYAPELHFGRTSVALLPRKRIEGLPRPKGRASLQ
jgi:hypothetical protein